VSDFLAQGRMAGAARKKRKKKTYSFQSIEHATAATRPARCRMVGGCAIT
jgi:hypothetical protein